MDICDLQVYQEKALKDKERYRIEMEEYRERLRTGQVISDAIPLQQRHPEVDVDMAEADIKLDETGGDSPQTPENDSSSGGSEYEDDKTTEKDMDMEPSAEVGLTAETSNVGLETLAEEAAFQPKGEENAGDNRVDKVDDDIFRNDLVEKGGGGEDYGESLAHS